MENCWRDTDKGNSKWETCSRTIFFGTILTYSVAWKNASLCSDKHTDVYNWHRHGGTHSVVAV